MNDMKTYFWQTRTWKGVMLGALVLGLTRTSMLFGLPKAMGMPATGVLEPDWVVQVYVPGIVWGAILGAGGSKAFWAMAEGNPRRAKKICLLCGGISFAIQAIFATVIGIAIWKWTRTAPRHDFLKLVVAYVGTNTCLQASALMLFIGAFVRGRTVQVTKDLHL